MGNSASARCEAKAPEIDLTSLPDLGSLPDSDALPGLDALPDLGAPGGGASSGGGSAPLPAPGKFDDIDRAARGVLSVQTSEGFTFSYTKPTSQNQASQLMMMHTLRLGDAGDEGYTFGAMYQSSKYILQGMTDRNLSLQGVAIANDIGSDLIGKGLQVRIQPLVAHPMVPDNQYTTEVSYEGSDWSAGATAISQSEVTPLSCTVMQSLTDKWAAGFKLDAMALQVDAAPRRNTPRAPSARSLIRHSPRLGQVFTDSASAGPDRRRRSGCAAEPADDGGQAAPRGQQLQTRDR